ncbi:MAG TPA: protein kinase [Candidatus Sulfotelmatobacter sp.]|nr:protein kinase [Candidatus Sulfotelmatobacter sp.]
MTGQLVGHYRILEKIGAGGMGEVYRARDERLGRDVALKLIRPASSENPDLLRRFEQEARAAAALNHPNILAIYDVGFDGGTPFIVSELLEGKPLRQRLLEGPIPIREAAEYALQVAHGLTAAHGRHIVHRDLKPENLFVTNEGRIKILDFGVAKLQSPSEDGRPIESLTTVTKSGTVVGTVAYMSPEQLRGKPVDHRSDIFTFGAILYEILTGQRAFRGETEVDTMSAVLREEPPEANLERAAIPLGYRDIVKHCVEKEPENRFQSTHDLAFALQTISGSSSSGQARFLSPKPQTHRLLPWAVVAALALAVLVLAVMQLSPGISPPAYHRLTFESGTVYSARFAPDGQSIVYSAAWNGKPVQLFSTVGNSLQAQPLTLTDANLLAVSRTNELAVVLGGHHTGQLETVDGMLASTPLAGGSPRELLPDVRWADWDANGKLAVVHYVDGRSRLEYPVGTVLYQSGGWISHIRLSPRGDRIAFIDHPALWDDRGTVCLVDLTGHFRTLSAEWESASGLAWHPNGNEIWFTAANKGNSLDLLAVNLTGRVRTLLTLPVALTLQDVASDGRVLATLNSKRLAMGAGALGSNEDVDLSWHDWNIAKDISSDGQSVLFEDASELGGTSYAVAIRKLDGSLPIRIGEGSAGGLSPDGKWAISIAADSPDQVTLLPVGAGQPRPVDASGLEHIQNGWARFLADGKQLMVNGNETGHAARCYLLSLSSAKPEAVTPEGIRCGPSSPDSRLVVGVGPNLTVALYPVAGGPPRLVPGVEAGFRPVQWSADGSTLYGYHDGELPGRIYSVNIATGKKTLLQELRPGVPAGVVNISPVVVGRDGKRFAYSYNQTLSVLYLISGLH